MPTDTEIAPHYVNGELINNLPDVRWRHLVWAKVNGLIQQFYHLGDIGSYYPQDTSEKLYGYDRFPRQPPSGLDLEIAVLLPQRFSLEVHRSHLFVGCMHCASESEEASG